MEAYEKTYNVHTSNPLTEGVIMPEPKPEIDKPEPKHRCDNPSCRIDGVAASNRSQSEFYAANPRVRATS